MMMSKPIMHKKCLIWDLDHTIWDGVLLEDPDVTIKAHIVDTIRMLDERGILQSIASRNDYNKAVNKLQELGLFDFFLHPQINWNRKSSSIKEISKLLNISIDSIAFIDDQLFEREEVSFHLPEVLCLREEIAPQLVDMQEFKPSVITLDSKNRRSMYLSDMLYKQAEETFEGATEDFLSSLGMILSVSRVEENDLLRAEELTVRTNQLNATGYTYSFEELDFFRTSDQHLLVMAELEDKYGYYGKIGLALLEIKEETWVLKLLLMSCRVMSRGLGNVMLSLILNMAKNEKVHFHAEFVPTDRNRMMYITYKFAGFKEYDNNLRQGCRVLKHDLTHIQPIPEYVKVLLI